MSVHQPDPGTAALPEHLTCQHVTDAMIDYLTGDLRPENIRRFDEHLQGCPDCIAFFNTYNSTIRATRALSYDEIPELMRSRVRQALIKMITGR